MNKFNLSFKKVKDFSFVAEGKIIEKIIGKLVSASSSSSLKSEFFVTSNGSQVALICVNSEILYITEVETQKVSGEGAFGFNAQVLQGITKNRALMEFKFSGSQVKFNGTKTKYNGDFPAIPVAEESGNYLKSVYKEGDKDKKINADIMASMNQAFKVTGLKNIFEEIEIPRLVSMTGDRIKVFGYDKLHFSAYTKKIKCPKIQFAIRPSYINLIDKMEGHPTFKVKNNSIILESKTTLIQFPTVQATAEEYEAIPKLFKMLKTPKMSNYDHERFLILVDSLMTFDTDNSAFTITSDNNTLTGTFKTNNGSASDQFKIKNGSKFTIAIDTKNLKDLLSAALRQLKGDVTIATYKENQIVTFTKRSEDYTLVVGSVLK